MKCANDSMTDLEVGVLSFVDIFVVAVVIVKPAISTAQPIISPSKTRKQVILLLCGNKLNPLRALANDTPVCGSS